MLRKITKSGIALGIALGALTLLLLSAAVAQTVKVTYERLTEDVANPERGLFNYDDDREGDQKPLIGDDLKAKRINDHQTVVYRHYTLVKFKKKPLSKEYLLFLKQDAVIARKAGVKMIVRFAYEENFKSCDSNKSGASFKQVMEHLGQLSDYFKENSDVIAVVEAGFVGTYGEWHYGNDDFGLCKNPKYGPRAEVVLKLLQLLPGSRVISLRTPYHKRGVIAEWKKQGKPATEIDALAKRIGFHNDAFLADESDLGTFKDESDRVMMAADTVFSPMLGESSGNSLRPGVNPFSTWEKAEFAAKKYHWSLISGFDDGFVFTQGYICANGDKWKKWEEGNECENKTLIDRWSDAQRNQFRRNLGYRFVLLNGNYPQKTKAGAEIEIALNLANEGWASPFNRRPVFLVLRNAAVQTDVRMIELKDFDPRQWHAQTTISLVTKAKIDAPPGAYDLYLYLPDAALDINFCAKDDCDPADYAIRLANLGMWEVVNGKATGFNNLKHRLVVE